MQYQKIHLQQHNFLLVILAYSCFFGETLPPPPQKNINQTKNRQLQTNSHHLLFLFRSWFPFPFDEAPMTFLRSSGLMDPEPSASKRLKADKTASFHNGKCGGEDGWVGVGRWVGLGWSLSGWLGRWLGWVRGCLQAIQVLQWFFYPKHSWGF